MNSDSNASQSAEELLRILIVDDDAAMCTSLSRVLSLDGYLVTTLGSCRELLSRADLAGFFAILLDRRLPDGDAGETVVELRKQAADAAILIVTGHADLNSTLAAIRHGVDDYLIKPVEPDALRARLQSLAQLYRMRRTLKASEARMRFLVENLPAGAVYVDRDNLFLNRAAVKMIGYSGEEVGTVSSWFNVLWREKADDCWQKYLAVRSQGFPQPCRLPIVRRDGVARELEIAGYRYDHHEVWLVTDVTELHDTQRKLVQAERLAAIGQVVTGLAHESRNALQRARGCLDLLELDLEDQTEQMDLIDRIRRSLADLQRNYEEVRNYAAPIILQREQVDICDLAKAVFDDLQFQYPNSRHEFEIDAGPAPVCNSLDRHRMRQVFCNLLENALAASTSESTIRMSVQMADDVGCQVQCVEIVDEGSGLSPETQARIFEPFYTTKQSGTGLGMAICRRIIEAHQGTISAHSPNGRGTRISMRLPYRPPPGCS